MSNKDKNRHLIIIIGIVLMIVIVFILTFGNYIPKAKDKSIYNDIDFNKLHEDIEDEIKSRNVALAKIKSEKDDLLKKINLSINLLKFIIVIVWFTANFIMYFWCKEKYSINEFIQLNEALIIFLVFILFMISEKFTNLHLAFEALKKGIIKKITTKYEVSNQKEKKILKEIYFLEAIYYTHPGILQKTNN